MIKKSGVSLFAWVVLSIVGLIFFVSGPANAVAPTNTTSYWKLDETAPTAADVAGTYTDSVGSNDGASTGVSPTLSPIPGGGQIDGGLVFDGSDSGIEVPADTTFDWTTTESFSIELWAKPPTGLPAATEVFVGRTDGVNLDWWIGLRGTGVAGFMLTANNGDGGLIEGTTDLTDDAWHHIAVVRDADDDTPPAGIISHWKLDETAPVAADVAGTYTDSVGSNDGASTGVSPMLSPIPEGGQIDGALAFDGSDSGIEVPADDSFNWSATDSFSIEAWVKPPTGLPAATEVFIGRTDSGGNLDWWIGLRGTGVAGFRLAANNGDVGLIEGTTDVTDDGWHHIVAVRDASTGRNILYVDGTEEANSVVAYNAATDFSSATIPLKIGHFDPANNHFEGSLDEIAIYDRALSADEVAAHFDAGDGGDGIETVVLNHLYVDGQLEATDFFTYDPATGFDSATEPLKIGHFDPANNHFDGSLDEIAIFDTALTAEEVDEHFQAGDNGDAIDTLETAPDADAGPDQDVSEGDTVDLDGSGSSDADGTIASYAWTQTDGTSVTLDDDTSATPSFTAPNVAAAGETLTFELTVTDDDGHSDSDTVDIEVADSVAPVANAGPDQDVDVGDDVDLDGSGSSDADGTIDTYAWTQTDGSTVQLADDDTATPSFTVPAGAAGETLTFQLTVTDDDGLTHSDTVDVDVADDTETLEADAGPDQTVDYGEDVDLDGSDSTGTGLTYAWSQTAGTTVQLTDDDTATPSFTAPGADDITAAVVDTLTFQLTVTDGDGNSDTDTVDVDIDDGTSSGGGGGGGGCFISTMF
jgi:Concanavalin A-like lectin/glucanases superfamily/K319L-like, PKD domain